MRRRRSALVCGSVGTNAKLKRLLLLLLLLFFNLLISSESLKLDQISPTASMVGGSAMKHRNGVKPWTVVVMSGVVSAVFVVAIGAFCALLDPILQELRAGRVKKEDGAEVRMLGFWSVLVLSVLAGLSCCLFSWTLTYLNSYKPGLQPPTLLTLCSFGDKHNRDFLLDYGVVLLNGAMATLTAIWSLT